MTLDGTIFLAAVTTLVAVLGVACQSTPVHPDSSEGGKALFEGPVREVLEHRCIHCHHTYAANAGLNFQDRATVFSEGFVVPGRSGESRIWQAISRPWNHPRVMPGDGWGVNASERESLHQWIQTGAYWPEGPSGRLRIKEYLVELDDL